MAMVPGIFNSVIIMIIQSCMVMPISLLSFPYSAWLEHSPGSLEVAASEPLCSLDGREYHLPLPHHDGRDDASETSPDAVWIQRR